MSKHAKTNIVTKVLGYATIAIVGGTAVATFLPSSYYSGTSLTDPANILSSVEQIVLPSSAPVDTPSPTHSTAAHAHANSLPTTKAIAKIATSTQETSTSSKTQGH